MYVLPSFHVQIPCRFAGVLILRYVDPALLLSIYALMCTAFCLAVSQTSGVSGVVCLYFLFFFESICYPVSLPPFKRAHVCSCMSFRGDIVCFHFGYEELGTTYKERIWIDRHGCWRRRLVPTCSRCSSGCGKHTQIVPCTRNGLHGHADLRYVGELRSTGISLLITSIKRSRYRSNSTWRLPIPQRSWGRGHSQDEPWPISDGDGCSELRKRWDGREKKLEWAREKKWGTHWSSLRFFLLPPPLLVCWIHSYICQDV